MMKPKKNSGYCLAIIPARYDSKRFPAKMLAPILGKSLIQRTYENACRSSLLTSVVVATDDIRIFDHVKDFGAEVVMTSPNCINGTMRAAEAYQNYLTDRSVDLILNIQGDEPCLEPEAMTSVLEALACSPEAQMATAVVRIKSEAEALNPTVVKCVIDRSGHAVYFSRSLIPGNQGGGYRSDFTYYRHLGIYAFRPEFLLTYSKLQNTPLQLSEDLEQLKVLELGYKIKIAIINSCSAAVDRPEDIKKVEAILCKQNLSSSMVESVPLLERD